MLTAAAGGLTLLLLLVLCFSKRRRLLRLATGVSLLATRTGAAVLPIGISGTSTLMGREQTLPNYGTRIILRVGQPFHLAIPKGADRREALATADIELMRRIATLVEPRHRGEWEPWTEA